MTNLHELSRFGYRFRPVRGYRRYWVSDAGRVYSRKSGRLRRLKEATNPDGYRRVTLSQRGKRRNFYVHRLVLLAFVGRCPEGQEACHNDSDQRNNRLSNLRWDTPKANASDRIRARHSRYVPSEEPIPM